MVITYQIYKVHQLTVLLKKFKDAVLMAFGDNDLYHINNKKADEACAGKSMHWQTVSRKISRGDLLSNKFSMYDFEGCLHFWYISLEK